MSDDIPAVPAPDESRGPLVIVVTLEGWLELEGRVKALEDRQAASVPQALWERLERHRAALEDLKGRWNLLVDYLEAEHGPAVKADTPTLPESYQ